MIAMLRMRKEEFPNRWMVGNECLEFLLLLLSSRSRLCLKFNGMAYGQAYKARIGTTTCMVPNYNWIIIEKDYVGDVVKISWKSCGGCY